MCGKGRISACYLARLPRYLCAIRNRLETNGLPNNNIVTSADKNPTRYRERVPKFGVESARKVASTTEYNNTVTISKRYGERKKFPKFHNAVEAKRITTVFSAATSNCNPVDASHNNGLNSPANAAFGAFVNKDIQSG